MMDRFGGQDPQPCSMPNRRAVLAMAGAAGLLFPAAAFGQTGEIKQEAVSGYTFDNEYPAWPSGTGPRIGLHRFVSPHVQRGSMEPFATLAQTDGFRFEWIDHALSAETLKALDIFMVVNPYLKGGALDYRNFATPDAPSVYSPEEIAMIRQWVAAGGSLLVLADHSPFAGGAIKLLDAFGYTSMTGTTIHESSTLRAVKSDIGFAKQGTGLQTGRLASHPITDGALGRRPIDHFRTFTGQALIPPATAQNLLTIPAGYQTVLTYKLFEEFDTAPRIDASGLSQGAVEEVGKGRIGIFGETGGFTAQVITNTEPFGLTDPQADQNADFVLSVLRWLVHYQPN
ncbi:MAG: hypothetical protein KDJ80_07445 [Nitratireductor sp.]|nr:hypothetical protein [Nitratireductor sp.]